MKHIEIWKYYRTWEDTNWQIDTITEKDVDDELIENIEDYGYKPVPRYNEYYLIHTDKVHKIVVKVRS